MNSDGKRRLLDLYGQMDEPARSSLLDYAQFLNQRRQQATEQKPPSKKLDIPRPDDESVIAAIKRLRQTYPMLDSKQLINQTSLYLSENLLQGQKAQVVIDKLEVYFDKQYSEQQN